jgi:hypothetical protein
VPLKLPELGHGEGAAGPQGKDLSRPTSSDVKYAVKFKKDNSPTFKKRWKWTCNCSVKTAHVLHVFTSEFSHNLHYNYRSNSQSSVTCTSKYKQAPHETLGPVEVVLHKMMWAYHQTRTVFLDHSPWIHLSGLSWVVSMLLFQSLGHYNCLNVVPLYKYYSPIPEAYVWFQMLLPIWIFDAYFEDIKDIFIHLTASQIAVDLDPPMVGWFTPRLVLNSSGQWTKFCFQILGSHHPRQVGIGVVSN